MQVFVLEEFVMLAFSEHGYVLGLRNLINRIVTFKMSWLIGVKLCIAWFEMEQYQKGWTVYLIVNIISLFYKYQCSLIHINYLFVIKIIQMYFLANAWLPTLSNGHICWEFATKIQTYVFLINSYKWYANLREEKSQGLNFPRNKEEVFI